MTKYPYRWAQPPAPVPEENIVSDMTADVVVCGAGFSGITAALSAAEQGLSVIILEKGRDFAARGLHIGVSNSRLMRERGIVNDIDELRSMVCDTYREMRAHAESLQIARAEVDMHKRNKEVAAQKILNLGCKNLLSKEEIDSLARFLMGTKPYLLFKLGGTYHLSEEDRKDIIELIELK